MKTGERRTPVNAGINLDVVRALKKEALDGVEKGEVEQRIANRIARLEPETEVVSVDSDPGAMSNRDSRPPYSKAEPRSSMSRLFLSGGVLLLFALVAAIVSQVC